MLVVDKEYTPYSKGAVKDKSRWTEIRLQTLQTKLFDRFKTCSNTCILYDFKCEKCNTLLGKDHSISIPENIDPCPTCNELDHIVEVVSHYCKIQHIEHQHYY